MSQAPLKKARLDVNDALVVYAGGYVYRPQFSTDVGEVYEPHPFVSGEVFQRLPDVLASEADKDDYHEVEVCHLSSTEDVILAADLDEDTRVPESWTSTSRPMASRKQARLFDREIPWRDTVQLPAQHYQEFVKAVVTKWGI